MFKRDNVVPPYCAGSMRFGDRIAAGALGPAVIEELPFLPNGCSESQGVVELSMRILSGTKLLS